MISENIFYLKETESVFSFFDNDHGQIEKKGVVEDFWKN